MREIDNLVVPIIHAHSVSHLLDKLEVAVVKVMLILRYYSSELRHSFFSLCVSIQNIERAK